MGLQDALSALSVVEVTTSAPPAERKSRSAQWREEMKQRTLVKVSAACEPGCRLDEATYKVHVRAGDTEPFTCTRTAANLRTLGEAAQITYSDRQIMLPEFPCFSAPHADSAFLATSAALLEEWLKSCAAALPSTGERITFLRAVELDPAAYTAKAITTSSTARGAASASMAARVALSAGTTKLTNMFWSDTPNTLLSEKDIDRIVEHLCDMRGPVLKLAQLALSRDTGDMDPRIRQALKDRVLNRSTIMPHEQVCEVMTEELGADWRSKLSVFHDRPIAAASIGQVHSGAIDGLPIAMKIQFPGVKQTFEGDVSALRAIFKLVMPAEANSNYSDWAESLQTIWLSECDYVKEAANLRRYAALLAAEPEEFRSLYDVPSVIDGISTERVLTMSLVSGVPTGHLSGSHIDQGVRDTVGFYLFQLKMKELAFWKFFNMDLHLGNYLYNSSLGALSLVDFGHCETINPARAMRVAHIFRAMMFGTPEEVTSAIGDSIGFLAPDVPQAGRPNVEALFARAVALLWHCGCALADPRPVDWDRWGLEPICKVNLVREAGKVIADLQLGSTITERSADKPGWTVDELNLLDRCLICVRHLVALKAKVSVEPTIHAALSHLDIDVPRGTVKWVEARRAQYESSIKSAIEGLHARRRETMKDAVLDTIL